MFTYLANVSLCALCTVHCVFRMQCAVFSVCHSFLFVGDRAGACSSHLICIFIPFLYIEKGDICLCLALFDGNKVFCFNLLHLLFSLYTFQTNRTRLKNSQSLKTMHIMVQCCCSFCCSILSPALYFGVFGILCIKHCRLAELHPGDQCCSR